MRDDLPKGFAAGTAQAFRKPGRPDLGLLVSEKPCVLAALFTQNLFCAAPVQIDRAILKAGKPVRGHCRQPARQMPALANRACAIAKKIQSLLAVDLGPQPDEILLISTGVIGAQFDMGKWGLALPDAARNLGSQDAGRLLPGP